MRFLYTYILTTIFALILAACTEGDCLGVPSTDSSAEVYVSVRLNMLGGGKATTRATITPEEVGNDGTPDISMEDGTEYENYIDSDDVELFVFDKNKTFREQVHSFLSSEGVWTGSLTKITDTEIENTEIFHIVAVCNHKGALRVENSYLPTEGTTTLDEFINSLEYSGYTEGFTSSLLQGNAVIPMWGIKSIRFAPKGTMTDAGSIDVLRAMAKVKVKLSDELYNQGYRINYAGMNANDKGYVASKTNAYKSSDNTLQTNYNTEEDTPIQSPSIPTDYATDKGKTWIALLNESDGSGNVAKVAYVPEFQNVSSTYLTQISLNIVKDGTEVKFNGNSPVIYFTDYSTNPHPNHSTWDLIRNDLYDFVVTGITETGGLEANIRVMPWEYEEMSYELTQAPVVTIGWSEGWPVCYDGINYGVPTCYENSSYYAEFSVDVSIPEGVKWQAHLTNPLDFEFDPAYPDNGYAGIDDASDNATDYYGNKATRVTVKVRPKSAYNNNVRRTTNLYFTLETLVGADKKATIKWWADDPTTLGEIEGNGLFPMLGDTDDPPGEGKMIRIVQIAESEWQGFRWALLESWKEKQYAAQQAALAEE